MSKELIAQAPTNRGFHIAILKDGNKYLVIRTSTGNNITNHRYIVLQHSPTEHHARQMANKEWLSDMGRPFDL